MVDNVNQFICPKNNPICFNKGFGKKKITDTCSKDKPFDVVNNLVVLVEFASKSLEEEKEEEEEKINNACVGKHNCFCLDFERAMLTNIGQFQKNTCELIEAKKIQIIDLLKDNADSKKELHSEEKKEEEFFDFPEYFNNLIKISKSKWDYKESEKTKPQLGEDPKKTLEDTKFKQIKQIIKRYNYEAANIDERIEKIPENIDERIEIIIFLMEKAYEKIVKAYEKKKDEGGLQPIANDTVDKKNTIENDLIINYFEIQLLVIIYKSVSISKYSIRDNNQFKDNVVFDNLIYNINCVYTFLNQFLHSKEKEEEQEEENTCALFEENSLCYKSEEMKQLVNDIERYFESQQQEGGNIINNKQYKKTKKRKGKCKQRKKTKRQYKKNKKKKRNTRRKSVKKKYTKNITLRRNKGGGILSKAKNAFIKLQFKDILFNFASNVFEYGILPMVIGSLTAAISVVTFGAGPAIVAIGYASYKLKSAVDIAKQVKKINDNRNKEILQPYVSSSVEQPPKDTGYIEVEPN